MKKLLFILALISVAAHGTTLSPIQLLNPVGSTAGQVIASTGATTAPAWTSVTLSGLGGLAKASNLSDLVSVPTARTNLGLGTAALVNTGTSGANIPLLSTANTWALAQTFTIGPIAPTATVGTNTTQVATTAFVLANSVTSSSPTITTPNIIGVTNGTGAAAGSVGEHGCVTAALTSTSSGTVNNLAQLTLAQGDYMITGWIHYVPAGTTVMSGRLASISLTSGTTGASGNTTLFRTTLSAGLDESFPAPTVWVNTAVASTPVYLISNVVFTTSTMQVEGKICYQRVH